jgi:hypothetical protein
MEDRAEALVRLLNQRSEQSTPVQVISWATSGQERAFTLRLAEIENSLKEFKRNALRQSSKSDDVRRAQKGIPRPDQQRITAAVDVFFEALEGIGLSLDEDWGDLPADPGEEGLPQEQRLIVGRLLIGNDALGSVSNQLVQQATTVEEMRFIEVLLADRMRRRGSPAALDSLLIVAFAAFEDLLLSLLRLGIFLRELKTEAAGSEAQETKGLIKAADSAVKGGPKSWRQEVQKLVDFDPAELIPTWSSMVEIYLRRNKIVHNGGRVDSRYVAGLPVGSTSAPQVGEQLLTTPDYVGSTMNTLQAVGAGLARIWPNLLFPDERQELSHPIELVVGLLNAEAWGEAEQVSKALRRFTDDAEVLASLQVNEWMARRERLGSTDFIAREVNAWSPPDDEPTWPIAVAALLGDSLSVRRLLEGERQAGRSLSSYGTWPLIRRLAQSDAALASLVFQKPASRRPR